jgi:bloom syndrome protein
MSDDAYPSLEYNDANPASDDHLDVELSSQDDAEMQDDDVQTASESEPDRDTNDSRSNDVARSTHYPNLQVTQNIIHPKKLRRQDSAVVDCFQLVTRFHRELLLTGCPAFFPKVCLSMVTYGGIQGRPKFLVVFGKNDYKGKQKEIMQAAVRGADVLVIAPTGMGKVTNRPV